MPTLKRTKYVVSYDIADDKKRTKLGELLLDYGDRIQRSVFEADLDSKDVQVILTKAEKFVADGDSLRLYPLCGNCAGKIETLGRSVVIDTPDVWIV